MMHASRVFSIRAIATAEELAKLLTEQSWTLCTAFRLGGLLFANDATSEDGAPEWAVHQIHVAHALRVATEQVESITFGWMTSGKALGLIQLVQRGQVQRMGRYTIRLDHEDRCELCA